MVEKMRVRAAPSNTGRDCHVGNLRTFLFNWLVARQNNGTFILRIEDSDTVRSKDEYADNILNTMRKMGLAPDEGYGCQNQDFGPYMQSKKLARYQQIANQLIDSGHAYRCYCTAEELDQRREQAFKVNPKEPFKYDGKCRDRKDQDKNKPYVVRFKAPTDGETILNDKIFGKLTFPHKENYDFVLTRSDGGILYNLGCVIDDIDHKITLVIRGRDHLLNYVPQALLYQALGVKIPEMCHLPMLMSMDGGKKLSKRDGTVAVGQYIDELGYSPNALLNYLSKFGFGIGNHEVFGLEFLLKHFNLDNCKKADGKYDQVKLAAINYEHLKSTVLTSDISYAQYLQPFLKAKEIDIPDQQLIPFIALIRSRAKTFVEAANFLEPLLKEKAVSSELMQQTFNEKNTHQLEALNTMLHTLNEWNEASLRSNIQNWFNETNTNLREIGGALRVALLGQANSPELFGVLNVLGKEKSLGRINRTLTRLKQNAAH